jgi:hypothetical protein
MEDTTLKDVQLEKTSLPERYNPGWNVIIYNSDNVSADDIADGLLNSEVFYEEEIGAIIQTIYGQGYVALSLYYKRHNAKKIIKTLRDKGVHCEIIYSRINDDNVFKMKTFLLQEIALNNSFQREMCYSVLDEGGFGEE